MATYRRLAGPWGILVLFLAAITLSLISVCTVGAVEEQGVLSQLVGSDARAGEEILGTTEGIAAYALDEAQAVPPGQDISEAEQDPWEGFNDPMFRFNRQVDRFVIKPLGTAWDALLPDPFQRSLKNAIDNLEVVRRVVNNALQLKFNRALSEVGRFTINSALGFGGFIDVAKDGLGIQQYDEDFGQTLGVWGARPGPYLVLPFLPPLTIRDGVGWGVDIAMNPFSYVFPIGASLGIAFTNVINDRSLNLDRYERVEESVVDLYSAVRNAYLQRRAAAVRE